MECYMQNFIVKTTKNKNKIGHTHRITSKTFRQARSYLFITVHSYLLKKQTTTKIKEKKKDGCFHCAEIILCRICARAKNVVNTQFDRWFYLHISIPIPLIHLSQWHCGVLSKPSHQTSKHTPKIEIIANDKPLAKVNPTKKKNHTEKRFYNTEDLGVFNFNCRTEKTDTTKRS